MRKAPAGNGLADIHGQRILQKRQRINLARQLWAHCVESKTRVWLATCRANFHGRKAHPEE